MTQPRRENLPQQAGILCTDVAFRRFAAHECGLTGQEFSTEAAATFLRQQCQIASRRELADDPIAQDRFRSLKTTFLIWAGRIAEPR